MRAKSLPHPDPFLEVRVHDLTPAPGLTTLCAGYEGKKWRCDQLAEHLIEWLPEFALKSSELERLGHHNAVSMIREAARSIYTSKLYKKRGELGEILLHVAMRQVFKTVPAISKFYYKDSRNNTVKGFDGVHVLAVNKTFELWLGEVKFYNEINRAIRAVVDEIEAHTKRQYMRSECTLIAKKIDAAWPHAKRLQNLLNNNNSLDKIFSAVCIPVLLTYDSPTIAGHKVVNSAFTAALEAETRLHHKQFCSKTLPSHIRVHLFLVPLEVKAALVDVFDERLKKQQ